MKIDTRTLLFHGISIESQYVDIIEFIKSKGLELEFDEENRTIWFTQADFMQLFELAISTVSEHISDIYEDGELESGNTFRSFRNVDKLGRKRDIGQYNLDMMFSLGYRIRKQKLAIKIKSLATALIKSLGNYPQANDFATSFSLEIGKAIEPIIDRKLQIFAQKLDLRLTGIENELQKVSNKQRLASRRLLNAEQNEHNLAPKLSKNQGKRLKGLAAKVVARSDKNNSTVWKETRSKVNARGPYMNWPVSKYAEAEEFLLGQLGEVQPKSNIISDRRMVQ